LSLTAPAEIANLPIGAHAAGHPGSRLSSKVTPPAGSAPGSFVFEFDSGYYIDWDDLYILFQPQPDGGMIMSAMSQSKGFTFDLIGPDGTTVLQKGLNAKNTKPITIQGSRATSYGVNGLASKFADGAGDSQKVLILEYRKLVVNYLGATMDRWADSVAARHSGMVNRVQKDTGVLCTLPDDIDFSNNTKIMRTVWLPKNPH